MNEEKRNCGRATDRGEEAWIETACRRTETGYEAAEGEASEPLIAKLQWPKTPWRRSGGGAVKVGTPTWGDLAYA